MNLIAILVFAVAVMAILTSLLAVVGASRADRPRMLWYFGAMSFGAIWAIVCEQFLQLSVGEDDVAIAMIASIYLAGALMMLCLLGYGSHGTRFGKIALGISLVYIAFMVGLLINHPDIMFEGYKLSTQGNTVYLVNGWAYYSYVLFYIFDTTVALGSIWVRARKTRVKRLRQGDMIFLIGWVISGMIASVFNLFMPFFGNYSLIWAGPLVLSIFAISFYYILVKFRTIAVSARWLEVISMVILLICGVIVYMVIFYIIFTALFKIPNPSTSVLVLNFLMIVIVLLLMPVINEIRAALNSLIAVGQVDIAYVIKKLNRIASKNVDLKDLAGFLASHLHFAYIGFVMNGRVYGSKALSLTKDEIEQISKMKTTDKGGVWQQPNKSVQKILDATSLNAVAELRNAKGKTFGHLLVGQPLGKRTFERRDLIQLEMIINLVASVIDSSKHIRA